MEIRCESWAECQPEIAVLCVRHWEEIALNKEAIKLDPDWDAYQRMANCGMLEAIVARDDEGKLIGYQLYIVMPHMHYRQSLTAMSDVLFLAPEHRKGALGLRLIKVAEQRMKALGVQRIFQNVKLTNDWSPILDRIGYKHIEKIYSKLI